MGKSDSTGTYTYATDGASPGSPILSDGHALYTPGLSENRGGTSSFYSFDKLGNLWTLDGTSRNQTYYQDTTGFGLLDALSGSNPGGFGFGGGNGCQTDGDTGLVLMGHRYYDTRLGRFISQDPIGDGDNWYAYADNNPTNEIDPSGLAVTGDFGFRDDDPMSRGSSLWDGYELDTYQKTRQGTWQWTPNPTADQPDHGSFQRVWGPWSDWQLTDSTPLGGGGFMSQANPMEMRTPSKLQQIWLGVLIAGAKIIGGAHGGVPNVVDVPHVIAKKEQKGPTVEEKEGEKPGGSKFSLHNFEQNMKGAGRLTMSVLDQWGGAILKQNHGYIIPVPFGGGGYAIP